jgi:Ni/Co efflux regulator RcnB
MPAPPASASRFHGEAMHPLTRIPTLVALVAATALAQTRQAPPQQPRPTHKTRVQNQQFFYHYEWVRGAVLTPTEWKRGISIDYRVNALQPPPPGYQWREIDRNYVLASASTHTIAGVVAAPHSTSPGRSGGEP